MQQAREKFTARPDLVLKSLAFHASSRPSEPPDHETLSQLVCLSAADLATAAGYAATRWEVEAHIEDGKGRCLIPADGFYEWKAIPGWKAKQPMYIRLRGGELYAFAGIWTWNGEEPTCAIITTAPNDLVATIHDRMPVILTEHGEHLWLDADAPPDEAMSVLAPYPADLMEAFAVSTAVNHAGRDAPEMVEPVAG